jgi:hypothetical protein
MHKKFWFLKLEKQRKLGKIIYSYKNNTKPCGSEQGSLDNRFKQDNKYTDLIKRE